MLQDEVNNSFLFNLNFVLNSGVLLMLTHCVNKLK